MLELRRDRERIIGDTMFRIGSVSIEKTGPDRWLLRWRDRVTKRDMRRRISGLSRREIEDMVATINTDIIHDRGLLPTRKSKSPGLREGITDAIEKARTRKGTETEAERKRWAGLFCDWIDENYPHVSLFSELLPSMVQDYVLQLEQSGKAFDTVRLAVAPIKLAWRKFAEDYPDIIRPLPRIRQTRPGRREVACLEPDEVLALLGWLKAHEREIWGIAALRALAGLRTLEAAALRWRDVDLEAGAVTITKTDHHEPKSLDSWRTVPLCPLAAEILREAAGRPPEDAPNAEIFANGKGKPWTARALAVHFRRALRHAAAEPETYKRPKTGKPWTRNRHGLNMPRLAGRAGQKLRAFFATTAGRAGIQDRLIKAYIGHAPDDVLGAHYRAVSAKELKGVAQTFGTFLASFKYKRSQKTQNKQVA